MFRSRDILSVAACAALLAFLPGGGTGQATADTEPAVARSLDFPLTIRNIMRGPELVGEPPTQVRWTDDSKWVYFRWRPGGGAWDEERKLYRVSREGGEPERVEDEAADSLSILFARGALSPDRRLRVTSWRGDLYLVDRRRMRVTRLTETRETESSPVFAADGERVFFVREGNVFSLHLETTRIRQLTDIRSGPPPEEEPEPKGQKAFLEKQQEELFEHVRRLKEREEERKAERERLEAGRPEPLYIGRNERVQSLAPDPTGRYVVLTVSKPPRDAKRVVVPAWVTESGYTEDLTTRPKVGDVQPETRIGLLETATGKVTWLDLYPPDSAAAEEEAGVEGAGKEARPSPPRNGDHPDLAIASFVGWNESGTRGLLFSVSFDYKDWWLHALDPTTGELTLLASLHDDAWVGGPCFFGCAGWIPGSERAYYVSEETGYAHLYTVNADGSDRRALTSGEWEVLSVEIPEDRRGFLLQTSEASPFEQHVYTLSFDGSRKTRITRGKGSFRAVPSPDGKRMAVIHSRSNRPPELFLGDLREGAELTQVTVSPTPEWLTFPWIEPEIVRFRARDGVMVPARIYRPADLGAEPNGAGVIFVHGAGYLHNVHDYWSSYYREYMFHHFLAANGYTVLDIDYRGSAGYGRDWRTAVYRWMGGKDLDDQVDGARYLVESEGIDPGRIGIYGGSYGGFITLMALFKEGDVFRAGAALRSVTDWAHYNHWYTSRILNLPQDDEEAYRRSSPIYFADGLKGDLLIAHGMVDTNVHFSDVVRLAQRLIELGKENWELAVYPVENHGFVEPASWTDEYRRIFELFERTLNGGGG